MTNTIGQPDRLDRIKAMLLQTAQLTSKQHLKPNQLSFIYDFYGF
jgi:hypothetical protein